MRARSFEQILEAAPTEHQFNGHLSLVLQDNEVR